MVTVCTIYWCSIYDLPVVTYTLNKDTLIHLVYKSNHPTYYCYMLLLCSPTWPDLLELRGARWLQGGGGGGYTGHLMGLGDRGGSRWEDLVQGCSIMAVDDSRSILPLSLIHRLTCYFPNGKFHCLPWKNHARLHTKKIR